MKRGANLKSQTALHIATQLQSYDVAQLQGDPKVTPYSNIKMVCF